MSAFDLGGGFSVDLPDLPHADFPSYVTGWQREASGEVSALVGGKLTKLINSAGSFTKGFGLTDAFAALSSTSLGPMAGMLSTASAMFPAAGPAIAFVGAVAGLFSGPPPDPPPTIDGVVAADLASNPLINDRVAVAAGRLVGGLQVSTKHGVDTAAAKNNAKIIIQAALLKALRQGFHDVRHLEVTVTGMGKVTGRRIALALSCIPFKKGSPSLMDLLVGADMRDLYLVTKLLAYGTPRLLLREAMAQYGLMLLAESIVNSGLKEWKCGGSPRCGVRLDDYYDFTSACSGVKARAGYARAGSTLKLCRNHPKVYQSGVAARLLPALLAPTDSANKPIGSTQRYEMSYGVPSAVVRSEIERYKKWPLVVFTTAPGGDYIIHFSGDSHEEWVRFPESEASIRGAFTAAANYGPGVDVVQAQIGMAKRNNAKLKAEVERQAMATPAGGKRPGTKLVLPPAVLPLIKRQTLAAQPVSAIAKVGIAAGLLGAGLLAYKALR